MKLWNEIRKCLIENEKQKVCEGKTDNTYGGLLAFAESCAGLIVKYKCVAVMCDSELMAAKAILTCFAAGVTALPIPTRYGSVYCERILSFVKPDAMITDRGGMPEIVPLKAGYEVTDADPALIMCTSGTTGEPKGVMLTEENVLTAVSDITAYFDIGGDDTILIPRPLYHCAVLTGEFLTAIFKGCRICFYSGALNPVAVPELVRLCGATVLCGTPTFWRLLISFMRRAGTMLPLGKIQVSGECLDCDTAYALADMFPAAKIYSVYGLTEASPRVSALPPELFPKRCDSVGLPLRSVEVKVIKSDGSEADYGEEAVLYVKGGNVMAGYYRNAEKTAEVLCGGWLCTGDIAVIYSDGLIAIKGRADDMIIKGGMNIYPREIEEALRADRRVDEVMAYSYTGKSGMTEIGIKISGRFGSVQEAARLCHTVLPPHEVPSRIEIVRTLEKNGFGKIRRVK